MDTPLSKAPQQPRSKAPARTWQMWAKVFGWYDGDTFYGVLSMGFGQYWGAPDKPLRCRAAKINAPEMGTPEGPASRDYAGTIAPVGEYACVTYGLDEFARPLVDLILPTGTFSEAMLSAHMAVPYAR